MLTTLKIDDGFGIVQKAVMELPFLKIGPKSLYSLLCCYRNKNGKAWPTQQTLSDSLGVTVQSIRNWTKTLESINLLRLEKRFIDKFRHNLRYEIFYIDPDSVELIDTDLLKEVLGAKKVVNLRMGGTQNLTQYAPKTGSALTYHKQHTNNIQPAPASLDDETLFKLPRTERINYIKALEKDTIGMPDLAKRLNWIFKNRPQLEKMWRKESNSMSLDKFLYVQSKEACSK